MVSACSVRRHRSSRVVLGTVAATVGLAALAWSNDASALDPWETLQPLPEAAAQRLAVASAEHGVFLFGGRGAAQSAVRYDPATDAYEALADLPVATTGACGDQLSDGRIAVYGGSDPVTFNYVGEVQLYDPDDDSWTLGATESGTWACAAVADDEGRLHVFGGQSQQTRYAIYDAVADSWSLGPAIPQAQRRYAHAAVRDAGGRFALFGGRFSEDTWSLFDPETETWAFAGQGVASGGGCMVDGNNTIWVGGSGSNLVGFDVDTMEVTQTIPMPGYAKGVSVDYAGNIWAVSLGSDAWRVDPETETINTVTGLVSPYTYSDMTGYALQLQSGL